MNDNSNRLIGRRQFVTTTAMASSLLLVPRHVVAGSGEAAPSAKLNIAGIGIGGMGARNLANLESQNIVALCDVDLNYAAATIAKYLNARVWTDYREMLEKQKDIDAVLVATPDHTHAVIAMACIFANLRRFRFGVCRRQGTILSFCHFRLPIWRFPFPCVRGRLRRRSPGHVRPPGRGYGANGHGCLCGDDRCPVRHKGSATIRSWGKSRRQL